MVASRPESGRRPLFALLFLGAFALTNAPAPLVGQALAAPVLDGTVLTGDSAMVDGIVVLHHLQGDEAGEVDSLRVGEGGGFSFGLPNVPDPANGDVFIASVRHQGVLYFGPTITAAIQLDSLYTIHTYDTLVAPAQGVEVPLQSRSVFLEPGADGWQVTDLFQLRNDEQRTIVARSGGVTWRYPLPAGAREVQAGEGELDIEAATYEDGALVVRAALPPGERLFFVRYVVEEPTIGIPNRGSTEAFDVLIREPAPPLDVEGLVLTDRVELEVGSTYLRYSAADVSAPTVNIVPGEEERNPPFAWVAVILTLILTMSGVLLLRPEPGPAAAAGRAVDRESLLREVARLDEDFESGTPDQAETRAYRRRRAELIDQIRSVR